MFQSLSSPSCQPLRPAVPLLLIFWLLLAGWTATAGDAPAWQNAAWFESSDAPISQEQDDADDPGARGAATAHPDRWHPLTTLPAPPPRQRRPGHGDAGPRAPPTPLPV